MAIPICFELPEIPDPINIPMFGFEIGGIDVLDQLQPVLAPLMPFFEIIDAITALFNCVKAIPDALGPPPDPTVLIACLPELGEKVSKLLALNPQLVIPRMMKQICQVIISTLSKARNEFVYLQTQLEYIQNAINRASQLGDSGLMAITSCAQSNCEQQSANIAKMLASLGRLIGLINLLLGMVGLPTVPPLDALQGIPLDLIIEPLDAIIEVFQTVHDAIPLP